MASGGTQISALHLAIAASGGVLLYAALQGLSPLEALKEVTSGKTPKPVEEKKSTIGVKGVIQSGYSGTGGTSGSSATLVRAAEKYLGVPYVYGGATPKGLDCSGLIVLAFRDAYKVAAPRTTYGQEVWKQLAKVSRTDLAPGDLIFWPGHVAMYVGSNTVIHSPRPGRTVMYAPLAQAGSPGLNPTSYQRYKGAASNLAEV